MLHLEEIEWVTCGISFGRARNDLHSLLFRGLTVRTLAPFDWLAFLRQWRVELTEFRSDGRRFYRITGPWNDMLGRGPCMYLVDDRTAVFDEEESLCKQFGPHAPPLPAHLSGPDWDQASRGLLAVAFNNKDGALAKTYDVGRPDDAVVLSLLKDVDRWTFGIDDTDAIALQASAAFRSSEAAEAIIRAAESLLKLGRAGLEHPDPKAVKSSADERMLRIGQRFLASVRAERVEQSVKLRADGFGTHAEFASIVAAEGELEKARSQRERATTSSRTPDQRAKK
jgi:hypothetical protein